MLGEKHFRERLTKLWSKRVLSTSKYFYVNMSRLPFFDHFYYKYVVKSISAEQLKQWWLFVFTSLCSVPRGLYLSFDSGGDFIVMNSFGGTHHKAAVFGVGGQRHSQPHLVLPLRHVVQSESPWSQPEQMLCDFKLNVLVCFPVKVLNLPSCSSSCCLKHLTEAFLHAAAFPL